MRQRPQTLLLVTTMARFSSWSSLLMALLMVLLGGQSRPSAQTLSDVEISAGYCFGALDTWIKASQAYEVSHPELLHDREESTKTFQKYQEIERHRPLTKLERQLYDTAKVGYDLYHGIQSSEKESRTDRERVRSYLMARGLFSPSRTLDF